MRDLFGVCLPLLTCTVPNDSVHDIRCPVEVAEVLKWSFLVCSVPVAFDGVRTRVLVDAPGKSSRDAFEGKAPQRRPQKPLERGLEEVSKAVGGGYCRLQSH